MAPALKRTKFLTNSGIMSRQLSTRCTKDHVHQPLVGGRCKDASWYTVPLVQAILRGIALQSKEGKLMEADKLCVMPMSYSPSPTKPWECGPATYCSVPKVSGGTVPIVYDRANFKDRYFDEYTGEVLAPQLIRPAIEDQLNYLNSKVWQLSTIEEMEKIPGHILVRSRWVLCNKGDLMSEQDLFHAS